MNKKLFIIFCLFLILPASYAIVSIDINQDSSFFITWNQVLGKPFTFLSDDFFVNASDYLFVNTSNLNITVNATLSNETQFQGQNSTGGIHTVSVTDNTNILQIEVTNSLGDEQIWQQVGQITSLINPTDFMNINTTNLTVFDLDIASGGSLSWLGRQVIMSASVEPCPLCGPNISRNQVSLDADFQVRYALINGTTFLTGRNLDSGNESRSNVLAINDLGTTIGFSKISSGNSIIPNRGELINAINGMDIMDGPHSPDIPIPPSDQIRIGFWGDLHFREDLSWGPFENKSFNVVFRLLNTTFITPVIFNDTVKYDEIFGEFYFPENGDLNISISTINTYENITGLIDGYNSSIQLSNSTFIVEENGRYFGSYSGALKDTANSDYGIDIFVNGVVQDRTHAHMTTGTATSYASFMGQGTFQAIKGDIVNLMVKDEQSPATDAEFNNINFIIRRIGN